MNRTHPACREIETDLVAVAAGEAAAKAASRVHAHVALCAPCRGELARYRAVEAMVGELRQAPSPAGDVTLARAELESGAHRVDRRAMYVRPWGNGEYCLPTCGSLHLKSLAELELFASRERAESTGLAPCTSCRPDLHPLPA